MKQYSVFDKLTRETIAGPFEDLGVAHRVQEALGSQFAIATWVAHFGLPTVAVVLRELDGNERIESVCLYGRQARFIASHRNKYDVGKFTVRTALLNTQMEAGEVEQ